MSTEAVTTREQDHTGKWLYRIPWPWRAAEDAFVITYMTDAGHGGLTARILTRNMLAQLLCRSPRSVYQRSIRLAFQNKRAEILEKLRSGTLLPIDEGFARLKNVMGRELEARARAVGLVTKQGYSVRQAIRQAGVPGTRSRDYTAFDINMFFEGHAEENESPALPNPVVSGDRFSPEQAPEKERARNEIIALAKRHLHSPTLAFDLPGEAGHSSIKIKQAFPGIKIFAAESDQAVARIIQEKVARGELPLERLYACNATEAFERHASALLRPFDLVNLDTCGTWSESLVVILNSLFDNRLLANNGILAITHLAVRDQRRSIYDVLRFALNIPTSIGSLGVASRVFSRDEMRHLVSGFIQRLAIERGYNLVPVVDPFEYSDDPRSPMSVYVYRAEYPVVDQQACQTKADLLEFEWAKSMVSKRGAFIEYLVRDYAKDLSDDERDEFNDRLVNILVRVERQE